MGITSHRPLGQRAAALALAATTLAACSDDGPVSTGRSVTTVDPGSDAEAGTSETDDERGTERHQPDGGRAPAGRSRPIGLQRFDDCQALTDYFREQGAERAGPWGLLDPWTYLHGWDVDMFAESVAFEADGAGSPATAPTADTAQSGGDDSDAGGGFTDTNTQESNVGEPDIVKTDGGRILTLTNGALTYVDVAGDEPRTRGRLQLDGMAHDLLLDGDRAWVFTQQEVWTDVQPQAEPLDDGVVRPTGQGFWWGTEVVEIDLSYPDRLRTVGTLRVDGQYLSARVVDGVARIALANPQAGPAWAYAEDGSEDGMHRATEVNRQLALDSELADWLPEYHLDTSTRTDAGMLTGCDRIHRPAEFPGFGSVSVVTIPLAAGLDGFDPSTTVAVLTDGQTVYSSTDRFYVATTDWGWGWGWSDIGGWNGSTGTDVHAFEIDGTNTSYVASGTVDGWLLNQFSLDEHGGYLRVITTLNDANGGSESQLVVLHEVGEQLVEVGKVGGLGRGEQLYAARLIGDVGFAVTFRQTDPFYVLDLSDPTDPRVTGELKIPGFSTYLHPIGDDRVLGLGQDATEEGLTTGLKLSLFDVSNPADPREVAVWTLPNGSSPAQHDHRAFQMIGTTVIVPVEDWTNDFAGAVLIDVAGDRLTEIGRIEHLRAGGPTSDCRQVTIDDLGQSPQEGDLFWYVNDPSTRVQICEPNQAGGFGSWACNPWDVEQIVQGGWWRGELLEDVLASVGASDDARVEVCWSDGMWQRAILRSLVIGDRLWTMTSTTLEANDLASLERLAHLSIG